MKRFIIVNFALFLSLMGLVILFSIAVKDCLGEIETKLETYDSMVGKKVVLNQDTLMIIDYSVMNNSLTLEDGRKVNIKLLDKIEILK